MSKENVKILGEKQWIFRELLVDGIEITSINGIMGKEKGNVFPVFERGLPGKYSNYAEKCAHTDILC